MGLVLPISEIKPMILKLLFDGIAVPRPNIGEIGSTADIESSEMVTVTLAIKHGTLDFWGVGDFPAMFDDPRVWPPATQSSCHGLGHGFVLAQWTILKGEE